MRSLLVAALLFAAVGCAYPIKSALFYMPEPSQDEAIVFVYRPATWIHGGNPDLPMIYVNDDKVGLLRQRGHYLVRVSPGPLEIEFADAVQRLFGRRMGNLRFEAQPGKIYFVQYKPEFDLPAPRLTLGLLSQAQAIVPISRTRLLVTDHSLRQGRGG